MDGGSWGRRLHGCLAKREIAQWRLCGALASVDFVERHIQTTNDQTTDAEATGQSFVTDRADAEIRNEVSIASDIDKVVRIAARN